MRILLTGATGLIGKEVGKLLIEKGHTVVSVSRSCEKAKKSLPYAGECVEWKGGGEALPEVGAIDAVINLMGENLSDHRWTSDFKKKIHESRVTSTQTLVRSLSKLAGSSLKIWIQGSAIGFYGAAKESSEEKNSAFTEFSPKGEGYLAELCEEWERAVDPLPETIRRVILRTGIVFSHKGGAVEKMIGPILNGLGGNLASGKQRMSLIHLEDMARFIVHAVENEAVKGAYNLVAEDPASQHELNASLCRELHVSTGPGVPRFALRLALGEMADVILEDQPVLSERLGESGFILRYPTTQSILKEISSWHQDPIEPNRATQVQYGEQFIPAPLEQVFAYFREAKNLEAITPPWLSFKIEEMSTPQIEGGTRIEYSLKIHGVPAKWTTDICEWNPPHQFVDNQLRGPYALWYHDHRFQAVKGGVLATDWIRFRLPLGGVGNLLGLGKVRKDIYEIFEYRQSVIFEQFKFK